MNTISYKGYLGTVNFSEKDECFYGKIEGIDGLVNFEGESVHELTEAFHEAVDDYVAYCVAEGRSRIRVIRDNSTSELSRKHIAALLLCPNKQVNRLTPLSVRHWISGWQRCYNASRPCGDKTSRGSFRAAFGVFRGRKMKKERKKLAYVKKKFTKFANIKK